MTEYALSVPDVGLVADPVAVAAAAIGAPISMPVLPSPMDL